jgi:hypothetical protein
MPGARSRRSHALWSFMPCLWESEVASISYAVIGIFDNGSQHELTVEIEDG